MIFLIVYVWAYARCARRGFASAGANVVVVASGALMLVPIATLAWWYYMIHDWPMNIGGEPNWTWYRDEPVINGRSGDALHPLLYGGIFLLVLVAVSWSYALVRMLLAQSGKSTI